MIQSLLQQSSKIEPLVNLLATRGLKWVSKRQSLDKSSWQENPHGQPTKPILLAGIKQICSQAKLKRAKNNFQYQRIITKLTRKEVIQTSLVPYSLVFRVSYLEVDSQTLICSQDSSRLSVANRWRETKSLGSSGGSLISLSIVTCSRQLQKWW